MKRSKHHVRQQVDCAEESDCLPEYHEEMQLVQCGKTENPEGREGPVLELEIQTCLNMPVWEPVLPLQFSSCDSMTIVFPSVSRFWFHRFPYQVFASCPSLNCDFVLVILISFSGFYWFLFILFSFYPCLLSLFLVKRQFSPPPPPPP